MNQRSPKPLVSNSILQRLQQVIANCLLYYHVRQAAQWIILALSIGFIGIALWRGSGELRTLNWQTCLGAGLLSLLLYPLSLFLQALLWTSIINHLAQTSPNWIDIKFFCQSHLARRIPGTVWYLAGRALSYQDRSIAPMITLISSAIEWVFQLWTAVMVYASVSHKPALIGAIYGLSIATLGGFLVLKKIYNVNSVNNISKPKYLPNWLHTILLLLNLRIIVLWLATYCMCWIIAGTILYFIATAIGTSNHYPQLSWAASIGISSFSNGFSQLMSFTGGWGVREITLAVLLRHYLPMSLGATVAVFVRILYVTGDLVWGGGLWFLSHQLANRATRNSPLDSNSH